MGKIETVVSPTPAALCVWWSRGPSRFRRQWLHLLGLREIHLMYPGEWVIFLQHEGDKPMTWVMYGVYARKEYAVKAASQVGAKRKLVVQVEHQDHGRGPLVRTVHQGAFRMAVRAVRDAICGR